MYEQYDMPVRTDEIKTIGGFVHYSQEMRLYLSRLPCDEAERIVREIEYRNRPRRVFINRKHVAQKHYPACVL